LIVKLELILGFLINGAEIEVIILWHIVRDAYVAVALSPAGLLFLHLNLIQVLFYKFLKVYGNC